MMWEPPSVRIVIELNPNAESICAKHDQAKYEYYFESLRSALSRALISPLRDDTIIETKVERVSPSEPLAIALSRSVAWVRCDGPWPPEEQLPPPPPPPPQPPAPLRESKPPTQSNARSRKEIHHRNARAPTRGALTRGTGDAEAEDKAAEKKRAGGGARLGAFEVYLVPDPSLVQIAMGKLPVCAGLHSKLRTRKWPHVETVTQRCAAVLHPIFERWHADSMVRAALSSLHCASADARPAALETLCLTANEHAAHAGFGLLADVAVVVRETAAAVEADRGRREADTILRHYCEAGTRRMLHGAIEAHQHIASETTLLQARTRLAELVAADEALRAAITDARANRAQHGVNWAKSVEREQRLLAQVDSLTEKNASAELVAEATEVIRAEHQMRGLSVLSRHVRFRRLKLVMKLRAAARSHLRGYSGGNSMDAYAQHIPVEHANKATRWHSLALLQATAESATSAALEESLKLHRNKSRPEVVASAENWLHMLRLVESANH